MASLPEQAALAFPPARPPASRAEEIRRAFDRFDLEHPEVWRAFERPAPQLVRAGRRRCGVALVVERIRWDVALEGGADFKVNNNFRALYARKWRRAHPEHADLFSTRALASSYRRPDGSLRIPEAKP